MLRFIPTEKGCYVLTTVMGQIIYVGLTSNLQARFQQHLDTPEKVLPTTRGKAVFFHWLLSETLETTERGWLNAHVVAEGALPILNKAGSPVSY